MSNVPVLINGRGKIQTKKELAKKLYLSVHMLARKEQIDKFVEELLISENSARTHISWCARELNNGLNKPYTTRKRDLTRLKREKAYTIFAGHPNLPRKEIIKLLETDLEMSQNSAATHCSISAKRFINENGKIAHKALA